MDLTDRAGVQPGVDSAAVDGVARAEPPTGIGRRRFLGYVVSGATLLVAADLGLGQAPAEAALPTLPQPAELFDLNDFLTVCALPTAHLIAIQVNTDGTASFALPRAEVGQGITTSTAMIIAEELDLPVSKVKVTLAPARPELMFNQLTGGSNTTISTFTPIRVAAAIAKKELLKAAALALGQPVNLLVSKLGVIQAPDGGSVTYGELAEKAASPTTKNVEVELTESEFKVIGKPTNRIDALAAVTGKKDFATDLEVKGALPTMVCRAPTLNGTPVRINNLAAVKRMKGVKNVVMVDFGVAVRAKTFGQCIDAIRTLDVTWNDGPVAGESDADVLARLRAAELPLQLPDLPDNPLIKIKSLDLTFYFRSNSAMDTNSAIADVRPDRATVWSGLKSPVTLQSEVASYLKLPASKVTVHVTQSGGSFGRRLFSDGALEAVKISKAMGKPVKLMWHRADDARAGRAHPMATNRVQVAMLGKELLSFTQAHTSVETDFRHGLGEALTANVAALPSGLGNLGFSEAVFLLTQEIPYDVGVVLQTLMETDQRFNTGSMRNIFSPDVRVGAELMMDVLADELGEDRLEFRLRLVRNKMVRRVLEKVAVEGDWGRKLPAGVAQGIAIHKEYKGATACLMEVDTRPSTVKRRVRDAVTGPRVTRATFAVDVGLPINPTGLEAQMLGGINDGIALAFTSSLHLRDGHFCEASWDNYFYTRQWNTPPQVDIHVMPASSTEPGGAGEAGVAASFAAAACGYAAATGKMPTHFPINHHQPLAFKEKPRVPPVPRSPVNGLKHTY